MAIQGRQLAIVIQDGIWILFLIFHIDGNIWFWADQPGWPIAKAQTWLFCPLHGCPRIVPAVFSNRSQGFFLTQTSFFRDMVAIDGRDIIKILHRFKDLVFHSNFLALIDKRNSLTQDLNGSQGLFTGIVYRTFRNIMGHATRFVVVFNDGWEHPNAIRALMGLENTFLEFICSWKSMVEPAFSFLSQHGLFEVKDWREDAIFSNEEMQLFIGFIENFPHSESIVLGKSTLL